MSSETLPTTRAADATGARTRLRVVHVITTLTTGGAERQLDWITSHTEHEPHVIALYAAGAVAESIERSGVPVEVLGMDGWRKALAIPRLARRIRALRPDVVHVHLLSGQLWGIPAARLAGVRTVVSTEHSLMDSSIENRPLSGRLRRLYLALERMSTRTVAVSATTRDRLIAWGVPAERITVIDNGIDFGALRYSPEARRRIRAELGVAPSTIVLGAVGRLEPVKRFPQLLDAVAERLRPGALELVVAGDGPLLADLTTRAQTLGVTDAVHLLGPRSDVPDLLAGFDALISPSRDETFGMAVVEALGSGLPVAYAQCPALDQLVEPPAWAIPLPGAAADDGAAGGDGDGPAIRAAVRRLEALRGPADGSAPVRFAVPPELIDAYGIAGTTAALDELYRSLRSDTA